MRRGARLPPVIRIMADAGRGDGGEVDVEGKPRLVWTVVKQA